jgi:hypothetical protein
VKGKREGAVMAEREINEEEWPGVRAAYDFVIPSYALLISRFEAADTRLTTLLTLTASLTLGGPLCSAPDFVDTGLMVTDGSAG